jgi:hypothetical protein
MFAVIKRITLSLIIGLCIAGLSLHFAVESLGGFQDHLIGGQTQETSHSHEGDQFVLSEPENGDSAQKWISCSFSSRLSPIARPLPPLLQPPKSI